MQPINEVEMDNPVIQTETFCPYCGKSKGWSHIDGRIKYPTII